MLPLILILLASQPAPPAGYTGEFRLEPSDPESLQSDAETAERALFEVCLPGLTGELDYRDRFARPFPEMQAMFDHSGIQLGETNIILPTTPEGGVTVRFPAGLGRCGLTSHTGDRAATFDHLRRALLDRGWTFEPTDAAHASSWTATDPTGRFEAAGLYERSVPGFIPSVMVQDLLGARARIDALRAINERRSALDAVVSTINDICPMVELTLTHDADEQVRLEAAFPSMEASLFNGQTARILSSPDAGDVTISTSDQPGVCSVTHASEAPAAFSEAVRFELLRSGWALVAESDLLGRSIDDRPIRLAMTQTDRTVRFEFFTDPSFYPPRQFIID